MDDLFNIEALWEQLLSRQPDRVLSAFTSLSNEQRKAIIAHLKLMAADPEWHDEQQKSAKSALTILKGSFE